MEADKLNVHNSYDRYRATSVSPRKISKFFICMLRTGTNQIFYCDIQIRAFECARFYARWIAHLSSNDRQLFSDISISIWKVVIWNLETLKVCRAVVHVVRCIKLNTTRCLAIAERPRCRVRYSFRQKWKTGTGRQYFTDIIGLFVNHCDIIRLKICHIRWKKTQNKDYQGVQDHSRSSRSVPIESAYAISY